MFACFTIEAMLNELAFLAIADRGYGSTDEYRRVERRARNVGLWRRVQEIVSYLYGRALDDPSELAADVERLGALRNGIVHYRFEDPPVEALENLSSRGYLGTPGIRWTERPFAWPTEVRPGLAMWAHNVACDTVTAIARLIPGDGTYGTEWGNAHAGFDRLAEP